MDNAGNFHRRQRNLQSSDKLEKLNEALARDTTKPFYQLHPTKGYRRFAPGRMRAAFALGQSRRAPLTALFRAMAKREAQG